MKTGRTINELALEVTRQQQNKRDFVIRANELQVLTLDKVGMPIISDGGIHLGIESRKQSTLDVDFFEGGLTQYAHRQLGSYTGIPAVYYDKLKSNPELLAHNLKHWLSKQSDRRMIRALDGNVRALLSDSYRRLDNYDLMQMLLPYLIERGCVIESCEVTESRLYIKAVTHKVQGEIKKGEMISMGVIVSNSEIGRGALSIKPFLMFLVCTNGAVVDKLASRKYHVGKQSQTFEGFEYSNEVNTMEDKLFWRKTKEVIEQTLTEATLNRALDLIRPSMGLEIKNPERAMELVVKEYNFNDSEEANVLNHLIRGGDLTSWGMGNAITRTAQDLESYDRATELESLGFLAMQQSWN